MGAQFNRFVDRLSRDLVDRGLLIQAGWESFNALVVEDGVSEKDRQELRFAFYAGAQHLFGAMNSILDSEEEPTSRDLARMGEINDELNRFVDEIKARVETRGNA